MKRKNGRYQISKAHDIDGNQKYAVIDTEYPLVRHELFNSRNDAEAYIASFYGMTLEEYRRYGVK